MRKAIKNVAGLLACIMLVSCSNDENIDRNEPIDPDYGDAASIVLKLSNEAVMKTRAFDDLQNDRTQDILKVKGDVNIFFFTATGNLVKADTPSATDLISGKMYTNQNDNITTAVAEVVVVGNVGDISTGVISKSGLYAKINTLENAQDAYMDASPDIWVYGSTTDIDWAAAVDGVVQGECSIDLAPILSRIDVKVNTTGITAGYEPADIATSNIDFKGVAVLYSGGYTHYAPAFMPTLAELTNKYGSSVLPMRSGLVDGSYPLWSGSDKTSLLTPASGNESILHASWNGDWNGIDNLDLPDATFTRTFYAFPSSKEAGYYNRNTILTVYGDHYAVPGDASEKVTPLFWPVHFSSEQGLNGGAFSQPLENGNVYKLTINMKGDFSEGGSGTTDPDEEIFPANIEVTINQVKWKAVIPMEIDFGN